MSSKNSRLVLNSMRLLLLTMLGLGLASRAALAQNAYDRGTPAESKGGQSSLSTYAQDKIETVNLANLNLNLHIPLVAMGGRGSASYTVALTYNSKVWAGNHVREDQTPPGGPPTFVNHFATTYNDGTLTRPNQIPLGSGWSICKGPAIKATKIGIDPLTICHSPEGDFFKYALTKVSLILPDGSEVEMRDALTEGAPYLTQNSCTGLFDRDRGRVWHSTDGSATTYVMDVTNGFSGGDPNYSGWVFLADGSRLKIASGGRCKQIIDSNGNVLQLTYDDSTSPGGVTYTDELGRTVVVQPVFNQTFDLIGATITITGYGTVAARTIFVDTAGILANLRSDQQTTVHAIYNSDADINGVHADPLPHLDMFPGSDSYGPGLTDISAQSAVTQLRLLDGRQFQFHYNRFGELAEIVYPGGGVSQIDYVAYGSTVFEGGGPLNQQLNRGVSARRVLSDGTTLEASWIYTRSFANGFPTVAVEVHQGASSGALLMSETHHFLALDAEYRSSSFSGGATVSNGTCYEKFENAREFQSDRQTGGGTQTDAKTWQQRANVVWSFDPSYANDANHGQENPPNDPRVTTEDTTLENGKLKRVLYGYDDVKGFNNVNSMKEYDFGQGTPGALLRERSRSYLSTLNGYCYTHLSGLDG